MERLFIVYCHTHKLNGKKYIGITCQTADDRWRSGKGYCVKDKSSKQYQPVFAKVILRDGWDMFSHEILYSELTETEAKQKEHELILYYHTCIYDPLCQGYNMTFGGDGHLKYLTEEQLHKAKQEYSKRAREKIAADPNKAARQTQYMQEYHKTEKAIKKRRSYEKRHYAEIKQDPDKYPLYLEKQANKKRIARLDPTKKQKMYNNTAKCRVEIVELRSKILQLNAQLPGILSEEDLYKLAAINRCRNKTYLNSLLQKFEGIFTDGKNNDRRKNKN